MICLKSSISDFYVKMLQFIRNIWLHHSRGILNAVPVSASFNKNKQTNKHQKTWGPFFPGFRQLQDCDPNAFLSYYGDFQ